jgi:hypothetical protein
LGTPLEAELHRLLGEALLADAGTVERGRVGDREKHYRRATAAAKAQELRGAMSLACLRRQQGRQQEAVALLAPLLGWFTEGSTRPISKRQRRCSTS